LPEPKVLATRGESGQSRVHGQLPLDLKID
jgi:hypothetical protein